jgi:hypothetical protein
LLRSLDAGLKGEIKIMAQEDRKLNCWEFKRCERQPGGRKAAELGVCPAAVDERLHGVHGGKNAGRACWVLAGTMCGGKVQGTFAQKYDNCESCEFFRTVKEEEGPSYNLSIVLLRKIRTTQGENILKEGNPLLKRAS